MGKFATPSPLTPEQRGQVVILAAVSGDVAPGGKTLIVAYWQPVPGVTGYNLYRWQEPGSPPKKSLNKTPIARVQSCAALKALVPEGSKEWKMLAAAFSSATVRQTVEIVPHQGSLARLNRASILAGPAGIAAPLEVSRLSPGLVLRPASPCDAIERGLTADEEDVFHVLANLNLPIRLAAGLGYRDEAVTAGEEYTYELRGVLESGEEAPWRAKVTVVAGVQVLPDPPEGVAAQGGDRQVLVTWIRNPHAAGFDVQRSTLPAGPYHLANDDPVLYDVTQDVHGESLPAPGPGFLDWQRWDDDGLPIPHQVGGVFLDGPANYEAYYYRVASRDVLGRIGLWSAPASATPTRSTPPLAPAGFSVLPNRTSTPGLSLTWRKVTRDVQGHQILDPVQTYRIHRAETMEALEDIATLPAHLVATVGAVPTDKTTPVLTWIDADPALQAPYGEKDFWYRLQCVDALGLVSDPSAVLSGRVPDVRPPGPTKVVGSKGKAASITVFWEPNSEPDLAGYQIYRSLCDFGRPYQPIVGGGKPGRHEEEPNEPKEGRKLPCEFILVGDVSRPEAEERLEAEGSIFFEDTSVPAGSPVCYAYWVRAYDLSGNLYEGDRGCPASPAEYVCQRLLEETPPPVPILAALKARNNGVRIEWISSPVQDLRAFHIYRSDKENGPLEFVGGVLTDGTVLPGKWEGLEPKCEDIPAEAMPPAVRAHFLDAKVEPNRIYWYRVSALDWLGNESEGADLTRIPAVSTFTYTTDLPLPPAVLAPDGEPVEGCGLEVRWDPAFDPDALEGFLIYRSTAPSGPFRQVSGLVRDNRFEDRSALKGTNYWYQVQALDRRGSTSEPSPAVAHSY
jgi:hypothetical protein